LRDGAALAEGALILATVVQAPYAAKAARLVLGARGAAGAELDALRAQAKAASQPMRLTPAPGAVRTLMTQAREGDHIRIASASPLREARSLATESAPGLVGSIEPAGPDLFESEGVEAAIEQALDPIVALSGGGRLVIEMTQALTAIDVDTAGSRSADAVNAAAAGILPFEIAARELSGTILIDFARVRDRAGLERLGRILGEGAAALGLGLEIGHGRRGLLDVRRARGEAPLAAHHTRSGMTHLAVPSTLSFPAQAARLARALDRARPAAGRQAHVPLSLLNWFEGEGRPFCEAILSAAATTRFVAEPRLEPDRFELVP
jgi:hypothetical protein